MGRNKKWVGWGCGFADFDNDGWPDLFVVNGHVYPEIDKTNRGVTYLQPRVLYRNLGDGKFADVSGSAGPAVTTPASGRGVAFGDLDNDGAVEIVVNNMNALPSLLKLAAKPQWHWIGIETIGAKSNRRGIGARVVCVTGKHGRWTKFAAAAAIFRRTISGCILAWVRRPQVDSIEVHWPGGGVDRLRDVAADRLIRIKEGVGLVP